MSYSQLLAELALACQLLERINYAFYVDGTSKALRPIMAETKPAMARLRDAIALAAPAEPRRQAALFAGLNCLPGQGDLFATDGEGGAE